MPRGHNYDFPRGSKWPGFKRDTGIDPLQDFDLPLGFLSHKKGTTVNPEAKRAEVLETWRPKRGPEITRINQTHTMRRKVRSHDLRTAQEGRQRTMQHQVV